MFRGVATVAAVALAMAVVAQFTETERRAILDALYLANLTERDLEYERTAFRDRYRMPLVDRALAKPLEGSDELMRIHQSAANVSGVARLISIASRNLDRSGTATQPGRPAELPSSIPVELHPSVGKIVASIAAANETIRDATSSLSASERRLLLEALPQWAVEEPTVKFSFVRQPLPKQDVILTLLEKVEIGKILSAAEDVAAMVESQLPELRRLAPKVNIREPISFRVDGVEGVIAGTGDDLHERSDTMLCIDLGGNDTYRGRYGAGPLYCGVLVDISGNDRYEVDDLAIGAGLLGIGLAYDLAGSDVYLGGSLTFGVGIAGAGALYDASGSDDYRSATLTQGFGQFGVGVLHDATGNDRYSAALFGQGAARTLGVGWLVDKAGNDTYRIGGLILNSPLFSDVHYSFGQGFASGYREDFGGLSGGIGLLTDLAGDDAYIAETYAQAASYWYSIGTLLDASGHDSYTASHYAQASAMHATSAFLFDLKGDDLYSVRLGACHAIGHDDGVAVLLDRAGNDTYAARDSRPGIGNANGLGLFVESEGEDRYFGPAGQGNPSRGSGSLGIFVDLDGADRYADGLGDGEARVSNTWGSAYDQVSKTRIADQEPTETPAPKPGSEPIPTNAEMESIYRRATQWGVGTAMQEVNENVNRLIGIGLPAADWMLKNKLSTANRLGLRAFVAVLGAVGTDAKVLLGAYIESADETTAKNALRIAMDTKAIEVAASIPSALEKPNLQRQAASAAGVLLSKESVERLMLLVASQDRLLARNALIALGQIGDERAYSTAELMLTHPDLPVRKAAIQYLAIFPLRSKTVGDRLSSDPDERTARIGLELLAAIGSPEALSQISRMLDDGRPGVKIQAMLGLAGRVPVESRTKIQTLKNDLDPRVRSVAARLDLGR
jgi:hypothetical protein